MHVAYLIPTIDRIGGAESQLILLAKGMEQHGWRVTVIALLGTGASALEDLRSHNVSFLSLEMRKGLIDFRGWVRLHHWLAIHKPDLVHAHLPHAALLARWSRLAAPFPVLIDTIHSPAIGGAPRRFGYRTGLFLPDIVTAVSASAAEPWLSAGMVHHPNLAIIPNGIDLSNWVRNDEFRARAWRNSGLASQFVWLAVGRLDPVKDHATLLRAFARLPSKAHLLLAGAGPLRSNLVQLSCQLGIADRVTFLGFQNNILPWMQQADAFVLASRWEGLPVSLMEACACELPAVITNTPGAREVLPNPPVTPVPVGDPDALAAQMNAVMFLPEVERRRLGILERQSIASLNVARMLDTYDALYRGALAINSQPQRWRTSRSLWPELAGSSTTETQAYSRSRAR